LDEVTKNDSKAWSTAPTGISSINGKNNGINNKISEFHDPLDDLYLKGKITRYWPDLPSNVQLDADPVLLSKNEVNGLSKSIREDLLGTDHPVLNQAASYFFGSADGGKKVRPMMVMLLSRALADTLGGGSSRPQQQGGEDDSDSLFTRPLPWQRSDLPAAQRRLAEISEMIHTASLFHDDVIDGADIRRGMASVHTVFGNKMAILAGDYLLARASSEDPESRKCQQQQTCRQPRVSREAQLLSNEMLSIILVFHASASMSSRGRFAKV
jgi:hypothetical protein